ncbi:MAG: hypothetical protein OEV44_04675 [Spirochaetota bacterium]|nr:hypothetical protein [Spirochaetota bacterium]
MKKLVQIIIIVIIIFTVRINYAQYYEAVDEKAKVLVTDEKPKAINERSDIENKINPFYQRTAERFNLNGVHYVNSDVYFSLSASDYGTGIHHIEYSIDNDDFKVYTTPFRILHEGNRLIKVRAIDNSGNIEKVLLYQVYVDNTSPSIFVRPDREIYKRGNYYYCTKRHNFFIESEDDQSGSGVKMTYGGFSMEDLLAKGNGVSKKSNFFNLVQEGVNEYYYTAIDNVGNMSDIKKFNIIVDNTPPVVQIDKTGWTTIPTKTMKNNVDLKIKKDTLIIIPVENKANTYIVNPMHTISFIATDPRIGILDGSGVASIYVKINDEDFIKYTKPIEFKNAATYIISVKAEDNAGNISEAVTFTFILDFSKPNSSIKTVNDKGQEVKENK